MAIEVTLDSLVGLHDLEGVDLLDTVKPHPWSGEQIADCLRFRLDGRVYLATEDPDDGYRSCLGSLEVSDAAVKNTFPPCRVLVRCSPTANRDTIEVIDVVTGLTVLEVGTDRDDSYYPWFVARFTPENMAVNAKRKT